VTDRCTDLQWQKALADVDRDGMVDLDDDSS
jgi:hypothetical protein